MRRPSGLCVPPHGAVWHPRGARSDVGFSLEEAGLVGVCAAGVPEGPGARAAGFPIRVVHRWLPTGEHEHPHAHSFPEFCHIESGRGLLTVGPRTALAAAHSLTVLPPSAVHALAADGGWTCAASFLQFEPRILGEGEAAADWASLARLAASGHGVVSLRGPGGQAIEALLQRIATLCRRPPPTEQEICRAALRELCARLHRQVRDARVATPRSDRDAGSPTAPAGSRPEIEQVLAYIERNLTRPISRQDLAKQAAFAPSYFSALFREATGTSIPDYINARRVRRAQELLRDPQTRVSSVCYAVGFRDLSNFNRVFKRLLGQTPREFRLAALGEDYDEERAGAGPRTRNALGSTAD